MSRAFLDTNVLVYVHDDSSPAKQQRARDVLRAGRDGTERFVVSTQVLAELYVVLTTKLRPAVAPEDAVAVLQDLGAFTVVAPSAAMVADAARLSASHQLSFGDALIVRAARAGLCDRVLTEDLSHQSVVGGVLVENPFADL